MTRAGKHLPGLGAHLLIAGCSGDPPPGLPGPGLAWVVGADRGVVLDVDARPGEGLVSSGTSNDRLRLLDPADGHLVEEATGHRRGITAVRFSPDGEQLVTTGPDRTVRLWSASPLEEVGIFEGVERPPIDAALDLQESRVVAVTLSGAVHAWSLESGEEVYRRDGPAQGGVMAVALSPEGTRLAWAEDGGKLRVWSTRDGSRLAATRLPGLGIVASIALSADGETLAVGAKDEDWLAVIDLEEGSTTACDELGAPPSALAIDGAGERLAVSTVSGAVLLLGAHDGRLLHALEPASDPAALDRGCRRLTFSAEGDLLFGAGPDGTTRAWHVGTVRPLERGQPLAGPAPQGTLPELSVDEGMLDPGDLMIPGYDPPELRGGRPFGLEDFPEEVRLLDGQEVATVGYPLAVALERDRTRSFLLSRYPPGCCFGTVPALDEWIEVEAPPETDPLDPDVPVVVRGVLEVGEDLDELGFARSLYRMRAESVVLR